MKCKALDTAKQISDQGHASENMLEESLAETTDDEPLFGSQDTLWDEDCSQDNSNFNKDMIDFGDLDVDLLMGAEDPIEDQTTNAYPKCQILDESETLFSEVQCPFDFFERTTEQTALDGGYHEISDDGVDHVLEDCSFEEDQSCLLE